MKARLVQALLLGLTLSAVAQEFYVLDWVEGDLDGDRVPERVVVLSTDSADPGNVESKKELWVLKRKGDKFVPIKRMPLNNARFHQKMHEWQIKEPLTKLWGLNYLPAIKAGKASIIVCFAPNSGEYFRLIFNGKSYVVEDAGD